MAIQGSGQISIQDIMTELGISGETALNDADVRALISKTAGAQMSITEWYGASNETILTGNHQEVTISDHISSGGTLRFQGDWIWSDNTATAALIIDVPCTFINEGNVIGKGGRGGDRGQNGFNGGPAINVTSTGVTIINSSGSYIAGGGGGGAGAGRGHGGYGGGGGGGAGGGAGGNGSGTNYYYKTGAAGGAIGQVGGKVHTGQTIAAGAGAASGGTNYDRYGIGGGGGGRILPGVAGTTGGISFGKYGAGGGGNGGAANNNGSFGGYAVGSVQHSSGGGGWGANCGAGSSTGGAAIEGTSRTLTNSGTVWGTT